MPSSKALTATWHCCCCALQVTNSYEVRSAQLQALLSTRPQHLHRMVSPRLLEVLDRWLKVRRGAGRG